MGKTVGTICIIIGISLCLIATFIFYAAHGKREIKIKKNKQTLINVPETLKKEKKLKKKLIKHTTK